MADRNLTSAEVSVMANVPVGTLRYWRHKGIGPKSFTYLSRKVMYRESDVLAWLDEQYSASA